MLQKFKEDYNIMFGLKSSFEGCFFIINKLLKENRKLDNGRTFLDWDVAALADDFVPPRSYLICQKRITLTNNKKLTLKPA